MPRRCLVVLLFICVLRCFAEDAAANSVQGSISGTVTDIYGGIIPGAAVALRCQSPCTGASSIANDTGEFEFNVLSLGTSYDVAVSASGFKDWSSAPIVLTPDQSAHLLTNVRIEVSDARASVMVYASRDEIATEQLHLEEQQRILGIVPNFYVVYDSKDAEPLSAKLKFKLATRVLLDPVDVAGIGLLAGMQQAGGTPNYREGAKGFGQRFGANAADATSDIFLAGAILPSLLHQDPRYFYQGTGTTSSRLRHALLSPFICRGDDGRAQINFSSLGGDLASSALSETYYPNSNRGPRLVFGNFGIGTGERMLSTVLQEFLLRRLTSNAGKSRSDQ